ncbi:MAG: glutamate cyclase domain-containing protein, partial [Bdellovibrionales bacterium]
MQIQNLFQQDIANRGFARDPHRNLLTESAGDFQSACISLARTPDAQVAIVTGFFIPHGEPPASETDGPLGALFLARTFS